MGGRKEGREAGGFLSREIVLHIFCCPSVYQSGPTPNHPPGATAEMRCEIFNLVYPTAHPRWLPSEPLPPLHPSCDHLSLFPPVPSRQSSLPPDSRCWLDS